MRTQIKIENVLLRTSARTLNVSLRGRSEATDEAISNIRLLRRAAAFLAMTVFFLILVCLTLPVNGFAKGQEERVKDESVLKEVEGEITWIGKDKIAITYSTDADGMEYEILLPYKTNDLKMEHKKNLGEIKVGDRVRAQYQEESIEYGDGKKEGKLKVKKISFVRSAPPKPSAQTLDEEEAMPLKGVK